MDRKKELKQQYLQMKPDMGILVIRSKNSNKVFLDATQDLKSRLNRIRFQLAGGAHPNKGLQMEWKELIQRFEFTFELAWKSLKVFFEDEGLTGLNSPKTVLREAFATGIIMDEELWLAMLKDRNATVHIYSEELAAEICSNIQLSYVGELLRLAEEIEKRVNN